MSSSSNLLVLDLSSYGSGLAVINQFCDEDQVKVFEVSPIGHAGILILLIKDATAAELLKNEIFSYYKANILSIALLKDFDMTALKIYLSQNKPVVLENLLIQEFSFLSEAFCCVDRLIKSKIAVIDFRVIRTYPLNAIVTSTSSNADSLAVVRSEVNSRASVVIEKIEPVLKQFYQIVQN